MEDKQLWEGILNTWEIEAASVQKLTQTMNEGTVLEVVKTIGDCKGRVLVAGCGTSAAAAKKIAHSLCCVERPACYLNPSDAVHGALGMLQKDDVLILISKGGNTLEIANLIPACKAKGAKLIGVTENPESLLGKEADIILKVKVDKEPCPFNMLATASTMAVISVFDAISIALMHYTNYTKEQFLIIHPGGAVGERLLKK
ncbi:SIS domain-containing protein [Defluviitalea saccharophila]|uniref:SIS domain-containing protein n=1 Tax=Defluviitalea saccharophila TaxID=879970 RepID=A0ABZ2Y3G0_9FIRM